MDDSTLISSMKQGIEYMLSSTEEFYYINNTSANYKKYVLATNAISTVQDLAAITFDLTTSLLNNVRLITVTPIPMSSSFQFLVTHLFEAKYSVATSSVRSLVKHKAKLSRFTPNAILYLSQALDYIASTIASLVITSFRLLRAGSASMPDMTYSYGHTPIYQCFTPEKLGNARISKWYKDLSANVTSPNCPGLLLDQYMTTLPFSLAAKELTLCTPLVGHKKNWIVTLDADDHLLFSKQLQFQPKSVTTNFVAYSCTIPLLQSMILSIQKTSIMKYTTQIASTVLWAEIMDSVTSYFYRFNISPDYSTTNPSALPLMTDLDSSATPLFTADDIVASTPVILSSDSHYMFYTDRSLINLGSSDVSIGWN
ncbi:hypothetical protein RhiirB3_439906 [Rhizophagus irregularis]|nr:hypothetical protein RhiirB3_439906 [Rhizophagus irregularis]